MFLILYGIQGSGKGTQGQLLARRLGIPHVSTGEILRTLSLQKTPEGQALKAQIDNGQLISDEQMTRILEHHLPDSVILDGYPRTRRQAEMLDDIATVDHVLHIELHEEEAKRRALARGRHDDTAEAIHYRMQQYYREAAAILEYYETRGKLVKINGDQPIEDVYVEICRALNV